MAMPAGTPWHPGLTNPLLYPALNYLCRRCYPGIRPERIHLDGIAFSYLPYGPQVRAGTSVWVLGAVNAKKQAAFVVINKVHYCPDCLAKRAGLETVLLAGPARDDFDIYRKTRS